MSTHRNAERRSLRNRLSGAPAAVLASVCAVAVVTGAVFALEPFAPVLSLGVLYVFAVLFVALGWGLVYALPVSIASMLAFNWFFLPPRHTFALADSENWVVLAVYLVTAVVVSELAARARRRAAEAERMATAELEAEALRRSDLTKTAILRAVSHDLRSPLTAIRTATEALEDGSLELSADDRSSLLATIDSEARRLDRLVGNLLDLSRLEVGAARPRPELWTVDGLVAQALADLGVEAERVSVWLDDGLPAIRVDGGQIERVLVNLLENALKFSSPTDPVELRCVLEKGSIAVRVVDKGPGLRDEDLERIFEPFEHAGTQATARGAGLGLAIAKGFAEANGGRLWAESRAAGASFVLTLPASGAPARTPA